MKRRRRYAAAAAVPRATWEFYDFDEDCDGAGRPEFFDLVPHFEDACRLGQLQKPYYWPFITDFGAIALLWEDKTRMIFCVEPTYELTKEGMSKITRKYASIQNAKPSKYRLKVDALMDAPKWPLVYTSKATRPRMTQYGADSPRNAQPVQPVTLELPDPSAIEKATTAVRLVRKRKTDQAGASPVVSGTLPPDSDLSPLSTEGDSEPQNLRSYKIERSTCMSNSCFRLMLQP